MEFIAEVDAYIADQDESVQAILTEIRHRLAEALPTCQEKFSYGMPTIYDKKTVIHYGANLHHLGIYPFPKTIDHFIDKLASYRTGKGTLQFPYTNEIPYDLIIELAQYNFEQQK